MSEQRIDLGVLEEVAYELSTEALSLRGSFDQIRAKLPDFFGKIKDFINGSGPKDELNLDLFNERKFYELAKKGDYMQLRRLNVVVPKGLNVSYLKHLETLGKAQDAVDDLIDETLAPFEKHLATLLSNPDTLKSMRESKIIDVVVTHDIDGLRQTIAKDFSRDGAERRSYGSLVGRQSDWPKITKEFNDLTERLTRIPPTQVLDMVEAITELLEKLISRMDTDPEAYQASGVTLSELAKISYVMAQEVEFYATHCFMMEQLQVSIEAASELVLNPGVSMEGFWSKKMPSNPKDLRADVVRELSEGYFELNPSRSGGDVYWFDLKTDPVQHIKIDYSDPETIFVTGMDSSSPDDKGKYMSAVTEKVDPSASADTIAYVGLMTVGMAVGDLENPVRDREYRVKFPA